MPGLVLLGPLEPGEGDGETESVPGVAGGRLSPDLQPPLETTRSETPSARSLQECMGMRLD